MYEDLVEPPQYVNVIEHGVTHAVPMKLKGDMLGGEWCEGFRVMSDRTLCGKDTKGLNEHTSPGRVWRDGENECADCRQRYDEMMVV